VIARSFIHLPKIGPATERRLWREGVDHWEAFLARAEPVPGVSRSRWVELQEELRLSSAALGALEHRYFASRLASSQHWRTFARFRRRAAYLDIETTGIGGWADVTVVGIYDGLRVRTYVHGENLDELEDDLGRFSLLITYNGATFDLPFLRRRFPRVEWHHLHIDLCPALRRLGYRGGLKAVERAFGLQRDPEIAGLDGWDAVRLWNEYRRGSDEALELLVSYNAADVVNLEALALEAYNRLSEALFGQISRVSPAG
jgi:uncharacterized protein